MVLVVLKVPNYTSEQCFPKIMTQFLKKINFCEQFDVGTFSFYQTTPISVQKDTCIYLFMGKRFIKTSKNVIILFCLKVNCNILVS